MKISVFVSGLKAKCSVFQCRLYWTRKPWKKFSADLSCRSLTFGSVTSFFGIGVSRN